MQGTQLVVFNKEDIKKVLNQFGFKIHRKKFGQKKKEIILGSGNQATQCPSCHKEILVKKVGTIAHGSRMIFCDNPLCFATWVAQNKIK